MAKITREEIIKLANLSRLELNDSEVDKLTGEIQDILGYVEVLSKVDTEGLRPTYQVSSQVNTMRPDEEIDYGASRDALLQNLPDREGDLIKVKRMIG